jgi:hypothetical protein
LDRGNNQIVEFTLLFNKYKKRLYNYILKISSDRMLGRAIECEIDIPIKFKLD